MADLTPTPEEKLTRLEQSLAVLTGRVEALEVRQAQRELQDAGLSPAEGAYLQAQLFGAAAVAQGIQAGTEQGSSYTGDLHPEG